MADTTFSAGTVIASSWLNDVNDVVYTDAGGVGGLGDTATLTKGDALIGVKRNATDSVARTQHNINEDEYIHVNDFGAVADGTTDNYAAIVDANAAAIAADRPLRFGAGTYAFTPIATINIGSNWFGEGPSSTVLKPDCTSFTTDPVLRVTDSYELKDFHIFEKNLAKLGTGIQLSPTNSADFTGHQRFTRLLVQGFNKNIDINNMFMVTFKDVRSESGAEGIYCAPIDQAGDNGYVTTLTFDNCFINDNTRNVYFSPALTSKCVTFIGGAIQAATGSAEQMYVSKLRMLSFIGTYFEGANTIPAIRFADASQTTVVGGYFNDSGGVNMSAGEVVVISCQFVTATDVITGATTNSKLTLFNCSLPSSGNSSTTNFLQFNAFNTDYNGVSYKAYHGNHAEGFTDDGYGASITTNVRFGNTQRYTVNNGTAFTINAPTNAIAGTKLTYIFKNTSGGAMGAITWNSVFKLPTLTMPATGFNRAYTFIYDGTNWVFQYQTAADVPN
jgi:hypothetical protein